MLFVNDLRALSLTQSLQPVLSLVSVMDHNGSVHSVTDFVCFHTFIILLFHLFIINIIPFETVFFLRSICDHEQQLKHTHNSNNNKRLITLIKDQFVRNKMMSWFFINANS